MPPRPMHLPILVAVTLLSGCAGMFPKTRVNVFNYSGQTYVPRSASKIPMFEDELPGRPYVRIARLEAEEGWGTSQDAFEDLRLKAAELGADAVIELKREDRFTEVGDTRVEDNETTEYSKNTKETRKEKVISKPRLARYSVFTGIAIRYKD